MTKKGVRRLFITAFICLLVQYAAVGVTGLAGWTEPWPAVVMPGFKAVWDTETQFDVPQATLHVGFEDGSSAIVPVGDVFAAVPASHHLGILRRQFMPSQMSGTERTEQGRLPETRAWLAERLAAIFGDRTAERLEVVWYRAHFGPDGESLGRTPVDTLQILLGE